MAAATSSLINELECAICSDQLEQPKFIGACNHTFCKECIDKYWVSLGKKRTLPCPECRRDCPIPRKGVAGLKNNFKLSNIIKSYSEEQQRVAHLAEIKCTLWPNGASCFCKDCDLRLCPDCKRQHDSDPKTRDHDLFGLCCSHSNGLLFFCNPCKQAVCGGCKVSDHNEGDHDVTPIRPVIDNLISRIQSSSTELEDAVRTPIREQEKKLSQLRDSVQQRSTSAEAQAAASAERSIVGMRKEIEGLRAESQNIQKQIDLLVKKKEEVHDRTKQLVKDAVKFEKTKADIITDIKERFAKSSEEINLRLQSLEARRKEITAMLAQGRAVGSAKMITIDTESVANLTSISQELMNLVKASRESDSKTVLDEITRSTNELELDIICEMEKSLATMRSHLYQIRKVRTKQVFRQLRKMSNVTFPKDRPCEIVSRLRHIPDFRLVSLGTSQVPDFHFTSFGTSQVENCKVMDTIYIHDEVSSALIGRITEGVHPASDMAVLSTGEVVVARWEFPPIRIFNLVTGAYRDINITHGERVVEELRCVETDVSDNMLVLTIDFLFVAEPNGNVVQAFRLGVRVDHMMFCSVKRIIYIAYKQNRIQRFHWSNNILKKMPVDSQGVRGFRCSDMCIGSGGEVLVSGWVQTCDNVIYQVEEGKDEENFVWRKIEYQDNVMRISGYSVKICINDDFLWLGRDDKIEKFLLV